MPARCRPSAGMMPTVITSGPVASRARLVGDIARLVSICLRAFSEVKTCFSQADDRIKAKIPAEAIADESGRFRLWVGNSAAHRTGRSSLDHKLREASHIRTQVVDLLENVGMVLKAINDIVQGERISWEDLSDSGSDDIGITDQVANNDTLDTELAQLLSSLAEINTCLMRLSIAIRNPAPHDHFKASARFDISHYEPFDLRHVEGKFPALAPFLAIRLGRAISRRRQYLQYREGHRARLGEGLDTEPEQSVDVDGTIVSSLPPDLKLDTDDLLLNTSESNDDLISETSYASSNNDPAKLRPPPLPERARDEKPFECPLCYRFTSVSNTRAWHKHVYQDLQPYVCTFEDCKTPDRTFESRHEWFNHELQAHRAWWDCVEGCNESFGSSGYLSLHLRRAHAELATNEKLDVVVETRRRQAETDQSADCVFCNATLTSLTLLRRHLGKHQEDLALFSLPSYAVEHHGDSVNDSESGNDDQSLEDHRFDLEFSGKRRSVGFMRDPVVSFARPVNNTESWALFNFEMHARKCAYCHDPYEVHRNHEELCEHGHRLAQEVASYVYHKDGKAFSTKEEDNKVIQVEIPLGYVEASGLLRAMERSLRHRVRRPFVSMDRSYHVVPTTRTRSEEEQSVESEESTSSRTAEDTTRELETKGKGRQLNEEQPNSDDEKGDQGAEKTAAERRLHRLPPSSPSHEASQSMNTNQEDQIESTAESKEVRYDESRRHPEEPEITIIDNDRTGHTSRPGPADPLPIIGQNELDSTLPKQESVEVEHERPRTRSSRPRSGRVVDWPDKIEINNSSSRRESLYEEDLAKKRRSAKYNVEAREPSARDL